MRPEVLAQSVARTLHGALAPVLVRLAGADTVQQRHEARLSTLDDTIAALRERLAVLETRPMVPGPPGQPGQDGRDGAPGKDGTAGLRFAGVFVDGKSYELGDMVTWAGSSWHCNEATTTRPGEGAKAWTLMVKRGRDGKEAKP